MATLEIKDLHVSVKDEESKEENEKGVSLEKEQTIDLEKKEE